MKSLFEQLGGTYHWGGDYLIPDIKLPDEDEPSSVSSIASAQGITVIAFP